MLWFCSGNRQCVLSSYFRNISRGLPVEFHTEKHACGSYAVRLIWWSLSLKMAKNYARQYFCWFNNAHHAASYAYNFVSVVTGSLPPRCGLHASAAHALPLNPFDEICVVQLLRRAAYIPKITVILGMVCCACAKRLRFSWSQIGQEHSLKHCRYVCELI